MDYPPLSPESRPSESGLPLGDIPLARPIGVLPDMTPSRRALEPADEFLLPNLPRGRAWSHMAVLVLVLVAFDQWVATIILWTLGWSFASDELRIAALQRQALVPLLISRAVVVGGVVFLLVRSEGLSLRSVGLTLRRAGRGVLFGLAALVFATGLISVYLLVLALVYPAVNEQLEDNAETIMTFMPNLHPLGFLGVAAVIAFYEELLFRGYLLTRLRRGAGSWTLAVVLSAAVFTALHAVDQEPIALGPVTILALVLSGVTIWRRSLVPAITAHLIFNLVQLLYLRDQAGDSWA